MSEWLEGRVIENRHWTPALFSLRLAGPLLPFEAGQFVKIALDIDGERVARAFSIVSPPGELPIEFYGVVVPDGLLSPRLACLQPGDALYLSAKATGFLVLSEVPAAEDLWLVATGTGIAPFLSILRTATPWARYANVILVHGVRRKEELVYGDLLDELVRRHGRRFRVVPVLSRDEAPGALAGRIPAAVTDGRLEAAAGRPVTAERSQFMLCGNPDMVKDATAALVAKGLRKHRRRSPGQITAERFW
jgi:ferredoxin--NADP+ reductase